MATALLTSTATPAEPALVTFLPAGLTGSPASAAAGAPSNEDPPSGGLQTLAYSPSISASQLSQNANAHVQMQTASFDAAAGTTIINNNVGLSIPPGAAGTSGTVILTLEPAGQSQSSEPSTFAERSFAQAQPGVQGTVFRATVTDQTGQTITTFAAPITLMVKYGAADGTMAAYLVDTITPAMANPNSFPPGAWLFFPPSVTSTDTASGVVTVQTQVLSAVIAIFSNSASDVRTVVPHAPLLSSFDPATAETFGTRPPGTRLRVVEPRVGDYLLVLDPATGGYTYVSATDVAPA